MHRLKPLILRHPRNLRHRQPPWHPHSHRFSRHHGLRQSFRRQPRGGLRKRPAAMLGRAPEAEPTPNSGRAQAGPPPVRLMDGLSNGSQAAQRQAAYKQEGSSVMEHSLRRHRPPAIASPRPTRSAFWQARRRGSSLSEAGWSDCSLASLPAPHPRQPSAHLHGATAEHASVSSGSTRLMRSAGASALPLGRR